MYKRLFCFEKDTINALVIILFLLNEEEEEEEEAIKLIFLKRQSQKRLLLFQRKDGWWFFFFWRFGESMRSTLNFFLKRVFPSHMGPLSKSAF